MQVFYAPDISGDIHILGQDESKHIIRVMRMSQGNPVKLIDGKGNLYEGVIEDPDSKNCSIRITGVTHGFEKRNYRLHIAISPLKNTDRFEWFIEKSVEIGIDRITPLICRNTEKPGIKLARISNIIVAAMKQSLKSYMPLQDEPVSFNDLINRDMPGRKLIAHCSTLFERKKLADVYAPGEDVVILIGPEGDFSADEIREAAGKGFEQIHLGNSRLRTETAGIAACHSIYFLNQ